MQNDKASKINIKGINQHESRHFWLPMRDVHDCCNKLAVFAFRTVVRSRNERNHNVKGAAIAEKNILTKNKKGRLDLKRSSLKRRGK